MIKEKRASAYLFKFLIWHI